MFNPLEQSSPRCPMRHCLVKAEKQQTGVGLLRWKLWSSGNQESAAHLSERTNSKKVIGEATQPTVGADSKVWFSLKIQRVLESLCHFLGLPQSFPVKYLQALKLQLRSSAGPPSLEKRAPAAGRERTEPDLRER